VCRLCRREGRKLFLKGTRCDTPKCAVERRESPPGMTSSRRGKSTDYAAHLREKQKVKRFYGVLERQFRTYFHQAERAKGHTGDALMSLLERRLDNVVYRLGFGQSRAQSRMMITHGHVTVNGRLVNIPSFLARPGDVVRVKDRPKSRQLAEANRAETSRQVPDFLSVAEGPEPEGHVLRLPEAADVSIPVETHLIVEICSK
jgi:small subunit ribosomal protein S4